MSYWSLRRAAERAAAGHELARSVDDTVPAVDRSRTRDWTPVDRHPATVTAPSPRRTLRQRAADLEAALWSVPDPEPADVDPTYPTPRVRARSSW